MTTTADSSGRSRQPPSPSWSEVTALFGGTFDPPHLGHRAAVEGLFSNPGVARIRVIPAASPPMRAAASTVSGAEDRFDLARIAFSGLDQVTVDRVELDRMGFGGPSYSFDTLAGFNRQASPLRLAWVIGTDQLVKLPSWHRFPELLGLCHWIVLERKGSDALTSLNPLSEGPWGLRKADDRRLWNPKSGTWITVVPTPAPALSATEIRAALALTGKPPENALNPEVWAELKRRGLYGTSRE